MSAEEAWRLPETERNDIMRGLDRRQERKAELEEERFKAIQKMFGG